MKKFEEKFDSEEFEFDIEIKKSHSGKFLESPKDSADVFFFPSEQIADFKENISPVIAMFQNNIIRENMENAVSCAMIDGIISALKQQSEYAEVYQEKINSDYYSAGISDFVKKIEELSGDVSDTQLNEMLAEIQTYF